MMEKEQLDLRLTALSEAIRAITSELSLEQVLQKIAQAARALVKAKYAALGVHDGYGTLSRFITDGLEPGQEKMIGPLPTGQGLLGEFLHEGQALIVNDIVHHPLSVGFPAYHPFMKNLLGMPIFSKGKLIGALYLADKEDDSEFTQTDQLLIEMLADHAAIALENAQLYERTQRLTIFEERERFARDLHDGIIQSIYAVGLSLDNAKASISASNELALEQIDLSLKSLAGVINDIRNYIFDLRPHALKNKGIYARLTSLIAELKVNTTLSIQTEIDPDISAYLNYWQASHLFHIAHEALSNTVRHAKAENVYLGLNKADGLLSLHVQDDGVGFTPPLELQPGHHGLANMQKRALLLGATLDVESDPEAGTLVSLSLHLPSG